MKDFWNDPPETPEPPECCDDYMDVLEDGACVCLTCGKRIAPQPDPDPAAFADMELPNELFREMSFKEIVESCGMQCQQDQ